MTTSVVITDTSVLINFLVLDQLHVLSQLTEFDFSVTEHVRAERTGHFPEQLQRLNAAFEAGSINEICVTDIVEVRLFAELTTQGLGIGECWLFYFLFSPIHSLIFSSSPVERRPDC